MEGNRRTQIRVGIFLGIGLLAALISIVVLGGERSLFRSYIRVSARLDQVQGLANGSVVSLSGITVGNIEEISFGQNPRSVLVNMKIDERYEKMIPRDSTVEVRTQGALGDKFVYIIPGSSEDMVKTGDVLEAAPTTDLLAVLTEKGGEAAKIFDILKETDKLLKSINADNRSEKIMKNFAEASANLKSASEEVRQLVGEIRGQNSGTVAASMKRLDSILTKIDKGEGTLGALINDPSLHDQLKSLVGASPRKQYFQSILQNSIEKKDGK